MHTTTISRTDLKACFTERKPFMPVTTNPVEEFNDLSSAVKLLSEVYFDMVSTTEEL